ncbi:MAG: hypothetical protein EHM53_07360 [Methanoregulaceae archaeon]|nr:MAG: hypothetical protein EHM53_07360 [Methanoregulaceae archaeon]
MEKRTIIYLVFLCLAAIVMAGCTSPGSTSTTTVATPTPQIIYVTVLVTPTVADESPAVTPDVTAAPASEAVTMDEAFLDYINANQIFEVMTGLETASPGSYSIDTGYNSEPKKEAITLTTLIYKAPPPGSEKMKAYRSAMMDALAMMDGSTAGFSRYRDAMQKVILAKNEALFEMHALGSSSVDAVHLSGSGNDVRWYNTTETGLITFTMLHTGDRNFAITLKDKNEKYISLLANEVGDYSGKKSVRLTSGEYYLEITADGDWTIGITSG